MLSRVTCVGGWGCSQTQCLSPAHCWGHSQTGVYLIFPSSRGRTHSGVVWPLSELLAHCQACGAASMGSCQGCISRGGSSSCTGGRRGRLSSLCSWWSPGGGALQHLEGGRSIRGMDPQKHNTGSFAVQASLVMENWFPFEFWLGENSTFQALCFPAELGSVFWGSATLPPSVLSPSQLSESTTIHF